MTSIVQCRIIRNSEFRIPNSELSLSIGIHDLGYQRSVSPISTRLSTRLVQDQYIINFRRVQVHANRHHPGFPALDAPPLGFRPRGRLPMGAGRGALTRARAPFGGLRTRFAVLGRAAARLRCSLTLRCAPSALGHCAKGGPRARSLARLAGLRPHCATGRWGVLFLPTAAPVRKSLVAPPPYPPRAEGTDMKTLRFHVSRLAGGNGR